MNVAVHETARRLLMTCSIAALVWVIAAHFAGPSDAYEKDQDKTMSYTTDIILSGRWILPTELGGASATKPPLYNWCAVPFVSAMGFSSECAHRLPSIIALIATWAVLVRIGRRIDGKGGVVGWIAGMAFVVNPAMFKLGFLARTDMLLTLWLLLGWIAATALITDRTGLSAPLHRRLLQLAFWVCVALAALTKGPPALVLVLYALIAPRMIEGRWSETRIFGWSWGIPLAVTPFVAWLYAAWTIDPEHVLGQLWSEEVLGRVTGLGDEGNRQGPIEFFYRLFHMPFYYVTRFAPWSIVSVLAMIELWKSRARDQAETSSPNRAWLIGASVMLLTAIGFFSLSTGKRAAYIAVAYGPGAMLAGWWLVRFALAIRARFAWVIAIATACVLTALTVESQLDRRSPSPGYGQVIQRFIVQSARSMNAASAADSANEERDGILLLNFDNLLLRAMLGRPIIDDAQELRERIAAGQTTWVFAAAELDDHTLKHKLAIPNDLPMAIEQVITSGDVPESGRWPGRLTLWRISQR